jgi:iron(III) transport system permease protein
MLCFAVPGTVAGVSYILAFNSAPVYLTGTAAIVIISMVMRNVPVGIRAGIAGLGQIDKSLDEASLSLRAGFCAPLRIRCRCCARRSSRR